MSDFAQLVVQLELQQAQFAKGMNDAARRLEVISKNARQSQQSLNKLSQGFDNLAKAAAAAAGAFAAFRSVQAIVKASDTINNLQGSFKALLGSAGLASDMMERVFGIVQRTGTPLEAAGGAAQRLTIALKDLGASNKQIETIAETFIQLGKVGGSSTAETAAGLQQLGQALASGKLGGDELKSIRENVPLVAEAIAKGIGVTTGELKQLGEDGKLTADVVANALIKASADARAAFAQMPVTFEQALNKMEAQALRFGAALDKAAGITTTLVTVTEGVAANLARWTENVERANTQFSAMRTSLEVINFAGRLLAVTFVSISAGLELIVMRMGFWAEQIKLMVQMDWAGVLASSDQFKKDVEATAEAASRTIRELMHLPAVLSAADWARARAAARGDELKPTPPIAPGKALPDTGAADKLKKETEALKARADAIAASVNPQFEFNKALAELNMLLEKGFLSDVNYALAKTKITEALNAEAEAVRKMIDPNREYQQQLEKINALYMAGKLEIEELIKAQEILKEKMKGGEEEIKIKSLKENVEELAETFKSSASTFFSDIISGSATAAEAFEKMAQSILQKIAELVAAAAAAWIVKSLFGGAAGATGAGAPASPGGASASLARVAANTNVATFGGGAQARTGSGATTTGGNTLAGNQTRPELKVVVNNNAGVDVTTEQTAAGDLEITIDRVRKQLSNDVRRGGNIFASALEQSFTFARRGT